MANPSSQMFYDPALDSRPIYSYTPGDLSSFGGSHPALGPNADQVVGMLQKASQAAGLPSDFDWSPYINKAYSSNIGSWRAGGGDGNQFRYSGWISPQMVYNSVIEQAAASNPKLKDLAFKPDELTSGTQSYQAQKQASSEGGGVLGQALKGAGSIASTLALPAALSFGLPALMGEPGLLSGIEANAAMGAPAAAGAASGVPADLSMVNLPTGGGAVSGGVLPADLSMVNLPEITDPTALGVLGTGAGYGIGAAGAGAAGEAGAAGGTGGATTGGAATGAAPGAAPSVAPGATPGAAAPGAAALTPADVSSTMATLGQNAGTGLSFGSSTLAPDLTGVGTPSIVASTPEAAGAGAVTGGGVGASGGFGDVLSKSWDFLKANKDLVIPGLALGASALMKPKTPDLSNIESLAASTAAQAGPAAAAAKNLIDTVTTGNLPPGADTMVNTAVQDSISSIKSKYSRMGMSGSTPEAQEIAAAQARGESMRFSLAQQLTQIGLQAAQVATGAEASSAQLYDIVMNAQLQSDQALRNALSNFASAYAMSSALKK